MARNLFTSALMGGLAGYASGRADEIRASEDHQRRLHLQENANENLLERMGARAPAGGGAVPSARVGATPAFESPEAERKFRATPESDEEIAAQVRAEGGQVIKTLEGGYVKNTDQWRDGLERLRQIRQVAAGDKISDVSEAGMDQELTRQQRRAGEGDRTSQEGILVSKGKDPLETAARAEAQEAKADKDKRTDPNARRGSGGGAPRAADPLRSLKEERVALDADLGRMERRINSLRSAMKDQNSAARAESQKQIDALMAQSADIQRRKDAVVARIGGGGAAPAQSPAAPASSATRLVWDPASKTFKPKT